MLFVHEYGEETDKDPLVIFHGLFGSGDNWQTHAKYWAQDRKVLSFDMPNHGRSPWIDEMDYKTMADILMEEIVERFDRPVIVLGHSMGGKIALISVQTRPDLFSALLVADIVPKSYAPHHDSVFEVLYSVDFSKVSSRRDVDQTITPILQNKALQGFLLKNVMQKEDGSFSWKFNLDVINKYYDEILNYPLTPTVISLPHCIIYGENSDYLDLDRDRALLQDFFESPNLQKIPRAGHWLHAENPLEFRKAIDSCLKEWNL